MGNTDNPYSNAISPEDPSSSVDALTLEGASLSVDGTFAENSDLNIPTEKASVTYVSSRISALDLELTSDIATNTADIATNTTGVSYLQPHENILFNPDGDIDQNATSGATMSNGVYYLDNYLYAMTEGGATPPVIKIHRNTAELEADDIARSCIRYEITTAGVYTNGVAISRQYFDATKYISLWGNMKGKTISYCFRFKGTSGETVIFSIQTDAGSSDLSVVCDGDWHDYHTTVAIGAGATILFFNVSFLGSTHATGLGNYYLKHQRCYVGSDYRNYVPRGRTEELAKCMSVYEKSYSYGIAPGAITTSGMLFKNKTFTSTAVLEFSQPYVVRKVYEAPTVTWYSDATLNASGYIRNITDVADVAVSQSNNYGNAVKLGSINCGGSIAAAKIISAHWTSDCRP